MDIKAYILSGIIETYVLGLCTPAEEQEFEQLRRQYPALDKAVLDFEEELEKNMLQQTSLPGDATDKYILDTLATMEKPAAAVPIPGGKNKWLKPFAIAASVLLVISAGLNYYLYRQTKKTIPLVISNTTLPPGDYEILKNPAITPVAMYGVGAHAICRCTMFWDKKTGKMYMMIHHLPQSSSSRDYQLWATVNGKPVSIGIVQDDIRGRFIELANVPPDASSFIVTLEKAGGTSTPTITETYLSGKI
jgi:anti-sigma-K factor RskA